MLEAIRPYPKKLLGCGVLEKEVDSLIAKNGWRVATQYLDSTLHNHLGRLFDELKAALDANDGTGRRAHIFYGSCHPSMDRLLERHGARRPRAQNCIEMLLGPERYSEELGKGAYFLLEGWSRSWEPMITQAFGTSRVDVVREIFHSSHTHVIAIRTPCSGDFEKEAEAAARYVDLPLEWMDIGLDRLESVLAELFEEKQA